MADPAGTVKARVLVVDEETVAHLAANALTKAGFETAACSNSNTAFATVETGGADVVVCSVQMPGVDTMDLLRRMRAQARRSGRDARRRPERAFGGGRDAPGGFRLR